MSATTTMNRFVDRLYHGRISGLTYRARALAGRTRPSLSAGDAALAAELRAGCACVTSLDALALPGNDGFRAAVERILPRLPDASDHHASGDPLVGRNTGLHCFSIDPPELARVEPELVLFGLEERLLDILESYLGLPVAFTTVHLRKDIGGGHQVGTRFWHLDTEDVRVVRMMVYLNDVTAADGPFEYIPRRFDDRCAPLRERALRSAGDPVFDEEMSRYVPESEWRAVTGPAGTLLLADNALLYHHGKVHDSERIVLIFTYTTRRPRYPELVRNSTFDDRLSPRQRASFFVTT